MNQLSDWHMIIIKLQNTEKQNCLSEFGKIQYTWLLSERIFIYDFKIINYNLDLNWKKNLFN